MLFWDWFQNVLFHDIHLYIWCITCIIKSTLPSLHPSSGDCMWGCPWLGFCWPEGSISKESRGSKCTKAKRALYSSATVKMSFYWSLLPCVDKCMITMANCITGEWPSLVVVVDWVSGWVQVSSDTVTTSIIYCRSKDVIAPVCWSTLVILNEAELGMEMEKINFHYINFKPINHISVHIT